MHPFQPTPTVLDYSQRAHRLRPLLWSALRMLLILAILPIFWFCATAYVDREYTKMSAGMTRVQVDRQLWAFASYPDPGYSGLAPGQFGIRY
jgi:hypothetical protein